MTEADRERIDDEIKEADAREPGARVVEPEAAEAAPVEGEVAGRPDEEDRRAAERDRGEGVAPAPTPDEFLDKEIGEAIGADERREARDAERDKRELQARRAGKKTTAKEQKEPGGLFAEAETPLERAAREKAAAAPIDITPEMLGDLKVKVKRTTDDGKTVTVTMPAAAELTAMNDRVSKLEALEKCLTG